MADANPWPDLVAAARAQVKRANLGNRLVAQQVLRQAAVGLRDVLADRRPDPERLEYLAFLLAAVEQITQGVPADKALGLWTDGRPHSVSDARELFCFIRVGFELDKPRRSVSAAITAAAKRLNLGKPTVERAWKKYGGKRAWMSARDPENQKGK